MQKNIEECIFEKKRECSISGKLCAHTDESVCDCIRKAYEQGLHDGYKQCEAMDLYEGSGIGGFHDY